MDDEDPCDCAERVTPGQYYHCPVCDTEWFPESEAEKEDRA